jgi:CHAT domain-containing protein/tetratricopeptide (TPR) repeat protein
MRSLLIFVLLFGYSYGQEKVNGNLNSNFSQESDLRNNDLFQLWMGQTTDDSTFINNSRTLLSSKYFEKIELDSLICSNLIEKIEFIHGSGEFEVAKEISLILFNSSTQKWGDKSTLTADFASSLAVSFNLLGNYKESLKYNLISLELRKKINGKKSLDFVNVLSDVALDYYNIDNFKMALKLNFDCLAIRENLLGKNNLDYAESLNNISLCYTRLNKYSDANKYSLQALHITEKSIGKNTSEYITALTTLAETYYHLGDIERGIECASNAKTICESSLGKESIEYSISLNWTSYGLYYKGDFKKAVDLEEEALKIIENQLGVNHPDYAVGLNNLAVSMVDIGEYKKAQELYLKSLNIFENKNLNENLNYAEILDNVSNLYADLGQYNKSLEYTELALQLKEKIVGKENDGYLRTLSGLADCYQSLGDYSKALEIRLEEKQLIENSIGESSSSYSSCLNNIASIYQELGEHTKALELNQKASEYYKRDRDFSYAFAMYQLSGSYLKVKDFRRALKLDKRALRIFRATTGSVNPYPYVQMVISALGYDQYYLKKYSKALKYHRQSLKIIGKALGEKHPDYASELNALAYDYLALNDVEQALTYHLKAKEIRENIFGNEHPDYVNSLKHIALDYFELGDSMKFSQNELEALKIELELFNRNKLGLDRQLQNQIKDDVLTSFHLYAGNTIFDQASIQDLYRIWVKLNGIINSDYTLLIQKILHSNDSSMINIITDLQTSCLQLNKYNEMSLEEKEKIGVDTKALEDHISQLEMEISRASSDFKELQRELKENDVFNSLEGHEVIVDITKIPLFNLKTREELDSCIYIAFIIKSKDSLIDLVYMKDGKKIERDLFFNYKLEASVKDKATDLKNEIFYDSFWKPIAEKIGDAKTVYVSLGGVYNNINLNTLYNSETGKYLIEEKDIRIVNSARDFVLSKEREKKQYTSTTSALYGFPDFNGNTTKTVDSTDFLASTRDLDQMWIDSLTRGGLKASSLPSTKVEVEQIAGTFQKNGWSVKTYTGETASETNIKKEVSPRILHVATHGYFFQDIPLENDNNRFLGMDRKQVVQDPMLRSGLLFTGANKTLNGESTSGENGLLSAAEASLLDLRETELVVMSACETGKGEIKNSEGVYGLRKAFADAGAQNIIMSLWKVDDKVTQEFMTRFYEVWLNDNTTIREAFNKTQLDIKEKYPEPYYWGAFILVGQD